jgi:single-strand DNA-binding protein
MNLNKAFILGRLTADPQLRTTPSGQAVASFGMATNRTWTDKSGAKQEQAEFHNIVVWGRQAEIASQFLTKGGLVLIEGRIQTRSWQSKDGQNMKTTEIIAERLQFGPRSTNPGSAGAPQRPSGGQARPKNSDGESQVKPEELPTIDIDGEDIKAEDLPF